MTDLYEIWYADAKWGHLTAPTVKTFEFTNPRWRTAAILKPLNRHISATVCPILMKFGMTMHIGQLQRIDR